MLIVPPHASDLDGTLRVALVDVDPPFSHYMARLLQARGVAATAFADVAGLQADGPGTGLVVLSLGLPGMDDLSLLRRLRQRGHAGLLLLSDVVPPAHTDRLLAAGADLVLAKPVSVEQLLLALQAVQQRRGTARPPQPGPGGEPPWLLLGGTGQLRTPGGLLIDLGPADRTVLHVLARAPGHAASRVTLAEALGLPGDDPDNRVTATLYRLRRRLERHTAGAVPLQRQDRSSYVFNARLASR